jgi:hypothetical protein
MTDTVSDKIKKVKASLAFTRLPDAGLIKQLEATFNGTNGNPKFPTPPVEPSVYKTAIDIFSTLTTDALDGGKKTMSAKRKQRQEVIRLATQLAHYVEAASNNDLATFNTSGFVAANNVRNITPQALPPATFQWIDRGDVSGQIMVKVQGLKGAVTYDVRYAAVGTGPAPGPWTSVTVLSPKAFPVNNLTPATTYAFQVRALGKLGYTDWSDSMIFICA